jgi:predicted HicB family RNase H-like nuclease
MNSVNIPGTDEMSKLTVRIPKPVHTFLKIKSMAKDKPVEELVLDAINHYFNLGEDT